MPVFSERSPLVSVVITSYNYESYLSQAIESALAQDYPNFEVLVLDNASTDGSVAVMERYAADPRMRIFRNETNVGLIQNHNRGIQESLGEYVVFLSADDIFLPGHLSQAIEYYRDNPVVDILYTPYYLMNEKGKIYRRMRHYGIPDVVEFQGRNEFVDLLRTDNYMCFPTMLFRRSVLLELGGLSADVAVAADYEMCLRYVSAGLRFGFLDNASVAVRWHPENRSRDVYVQSGNQLREHVFLLDRYIVPENYWRLRGREADAIMTLQIKMGGLAAFPQTYQNVLAELQPTIDSVVRRFNDSVALAVRGVQGVPRVSVILPTVGAIAYLEDALQSLQAQTYRDFEVVVVQDGGQEASGFVRRFSEPDNRIRYVLRQNQGGPAAARNTGLSLAVGEIVAYLDEDNRFEASHLELMVRALDEGPYPVAYSAARVALENVNFGDRSTAAQDDSIYKGVGRWPVRAANAIALNCVAHRRSCLSQTGVFGEMTVLEDWDFLVRLGLAFPKAAFVETVTVELAQRPGFADQHLKAEWSLFEQTLARLSERHNGHVNGITAAEFGEFAQKLAAVNSLMGEATADAMFKLLRTLATP